jgi:antitoxin MazE
MAVRQRIVKIGNSRGVRLPARILSETGLSEGDEVEVQAEHDRIVIRAARQPRAGWAEQAAALAASGDDQLLDGDTMATSSWDHSEWEW